MIFKTLKKEFLANRFLKWQDETNSFSLDGKYLGKLDVTSYLNYNFHIEDILHIGHFLFPDFCIVNDLVFLRGREPTTYWRPDLSSLSKPEWQGSFNRLNLWDEFSATVDAADDIWNGLLELIEYSWTAALNTNFPGRNHIICVSFDEGYAPEICFYERESLPT